MLTVFSSPGYTQSTASLKDSIYNAAVADTTGKDSVGHDFEPYETKRSVGYHMLAFPSYLLHWVSRPIGEGVKLAERKLPGLFEGERGDSGVFPLFETGGETGTAFGGLFFHRNVLGRSHKLRGQALFGSSNFNDFDLEYEIPALTGSSDFLNISGTYYNDPVRSLYMGNDAALADETRYSVEELAVDAAYSAPLFFDNNLSLNLRYRNAIIRQSTKRDEDLDFFPQALKGRTELFQIGTSLFIDAATGEPRAYKGRRFQFDIGYNHSIDDNRFSFINYMIEWQEFLAFPFLPKTRRLALRSRLQRVVPFAGKEIPFFELPSIGDSRSLRGWGGDRFRDDGSLLLTLEYRYPMWDFLDVVLFVDEGQVFRQFTEIALNDFHTGYGFGLHFLSTNSLSFRAEFAFSSERARTILSISPNF